MLDFSQLDGCSSYAFWERPLFWKFLHKGHRGDDLIISPPEEPLDPHGQGGEEKQEEQEQGQGQGQVQQGQAGAIVQLGGSLTCT